ncbi:hypothetical protein BZL30_3326 [Mycobacterium kansasii]|uniref:Uncharacterized protein n=1 Tax=Mycobacterium kansasii TaxID=1768 RepID=A0A1V3XAR4_MYCKA|nr:hypothetical protein BZL30_3326 [Mycobacterium kansasii]
MWAGRGAWAGLWCLVIGSSAAAAIVVTLRTLCDETTARAAAPFVAVAPTAIWIAVSADAYYAGVAAWVSPCSHWPPATGAPRSPAPARGSCWVGASSSTTASA